MAGIVEYEPCDGYRTGPFPINRSLDRIEFERRSALVPEPDRRGEAILPRSPEMRLSRSDEVYGEECEYEHLSLPECDNRDVNLSAIVGKNVPGGGGGGGDVALNRLVVNRSSDGVLH